MIKLILILFSLRSFAQVYHESAIIGDRINLDDSLIFSVNSVIKGSIPFPKMTESQRDAMALPIPDGTSVFVSDYSLKSVFDAAKGQWLLEIPLFEHVVDSIGVAPDPSLADNQNTNLFNEETLQTYKSVEVLPGVWEWVNQSQVWDSAIAYRVSGIVDQAGSNAPTEDIVNDELDGMDSFNYVYQSDGIVRSFPGGDNYAFPVGVGTSTENRVIYYGLSQATGDILQGRLSLVDESSFFVVGSCMLDIANKIIAGSCEYIPQLSISSQAYRQAAVVTGFNTSGLSIQGKAGLAQFESSPYNTLQEGVGFLTDALRPYSKTIGQKDPIPFTHMHEDSHTIAIPAKTNDVDTLNYYDTVSDTITAIGAGFNAACGVIAANVSGDFIFLMPTENTLYVDFAESLKFIDNVDSVLVSSFKISGYQTIANICYEKGLVDFSDTDKISIVMVQGGGGTLASASIPADRSVTKIKLVEDLENEVNLSTTRADKAIYHVDGVVTADPATDGVYVLETAIGTIGNNAGEIWERIAGVWKLFKAPVTGTQVILKDDSEPVRYIYSGTTWEESPIYLDIDDKKVALGSAGTEETALLELNSTIQGFLPPRLSTAERNLIVNPPAGLIIYNRDTHKQQHFDSLTWVDSEGVGNIHPITSTDNAIARYDLLTGALQDSSVIIDDNWKMDFNSQFSITPLATDTELKAVGSIGFNVDSMTDDILLLDTDLVEINEDAALRFEGDNGFHINFNHPNGILAHSNYTLPTNTGTAGQFLTTNGVGVLSWSTVPTPVLSRCGSSNVNAANSTGADLITVLGSDFYFSFNRPRWNGIANAHRYSVTKHGSIYENNRGVVDSVAWQYLGSLSLDTDGDVINIIIVRENQRQSTTANIYAIRAGTAINFCVTENTP
jgi:hypothetical protein